MKKFSRKLLALGIAVAALLLCLVPFLAGAEALTPVPSLLNPMEIIQQYAVVPVTLACLLIGWMLKHTVDTLDNKWIPLILGMVGLVGVMWINNWAFTPENFLGGLCSAALAVWIHNNYKNLTEKKEEKPPEQ